MKTRLVLLAAAIAIATMGAPTLRAAIYEDAAPNGEQIVDDTEPNGINDEPDPTSVQTVDCRNAQGIEDVMACEFHDRVTLHGYRGTVAQVFDRVLLGNGSAVFVARPLLEMPWSACTDAGECKKAGEAACKASGKGGPGGTWKFLYVIDNTGHTKGTCSGTCAGGGAWYVACFVGK